MLSIKPNFTSFTLAILLSLMFIFFSSSSFAASADDLDQRMAFWRSQAFRCTDVPGVSFPSKERAVDGGNSSSCEDGDMTLFNGLLCAAGEQEGCVGVLKSQGADGRWWRSPRLIGREASNQNDQVSFSPDQALGVLLYLTKTRSVDAFNGWTSWLYAHRPCLVDLGGTCVFAGWVRYCPDDVYSKGCTFRLIDCANLAVSGKYLGSSSADLCRRVLISFNIDVDKIRDFIYPTELLATGAAAVNETDYPLHLAAVELFLLKRLGDTSPYVQAGGLILAQRDSGNPFFLYLAGEDTEKIRTLLLSECPSPNSPSASRQQWSWERLSTDMPWKDSMYWDCIFMGRLLGAQ